VGGSPSNQFASLVLPGCRREEGEGHRLCRPHALRPELGNVDKGGKEKRRRKEGRNSCARPQDQFFGDCWVMVRERKERGSGGGGERPIDPAMTSELGCPRSPPPTAAIRVNRSEKKRKKKKNRRKREREMNGVTDIGTNTPPHYQPHNRTSQSGKKGNEGKEPAPINRSPLLDISL